MLQWPEMREKKVKSHWRKMIRFCLKWKLLKLYQSLRSSFFSIFNEEFDDWNLWFNKLWTMILNRVQTLFFCLKHSNLVLCIIGTACKLYNCSSVYMVEYMSALLAAIQFLLPTQNIFNRWIYHFIT